MKSKVATGQGHPAFDDSRIDSDVVPTKHSKSQHDGFSQKYHVTAAQESDEVAKLRDKAGLHTVGKADQIGFPEGDQRDRLSNDSSDVRMIRKSKDKSAWGGC
jgi:hypothetical protein